MINFGKLKQRIEVVRLTRQQNDYGEFTETFFTVCTPYAKVKLTGGGDSITDRLRDDSSLINAEIIIRFNQAVKNYTPDMFIKYDGKKWHINDVINDSDKRYLKINASLRI